MKVKEWIERLKEQDQEAELMLFEWRPIVFGGNPVSVFSEIKEGATQKVKGAYILRKEELTQTTDLHEYIKILRTGKVK